MEIIKCRQTERMRQQNDIPIFEINNNNINNSINNNSYYNNVRRDQNNHGDGNEISSVLI